MKWGGGEPSRVERWAYSDVGQAVIVAVILVAVVFLPWVLS